MPDFQRVSHQLHKAWNDTYHANKAIDRALTDLAVLHKEHVALLNALLPFWDQCQRGETENPERWQETYLALDDVLRRLL